MPITEAPKSVHSRSLERARSESDQLFRILRHDALYDRPIAERHRVIFYVGHLDGFDAIQIAREALHVDSPDPELDALFQAGIDPDSAHLPTDAASDWPSLARVLEYRDRCRNRVDDCLSEAPDDVVSMSIEHRLMHLETLTYMFHNFPYDRKIGTSPSVPYPQADLVNDWRDIPPGTAVLGKADDGSFGWDNEYDQTLVEVSAFRMQRYNVTNGDYLKFVRQGAPLPHFWTDRSGQLFLRCMFGEVPLPLDGPVYVTQQQATEYAKWVGKALPTEAQFHRAAYGISSGGQRKYPWGDESPSRVDGNFDFVRWDPVPVYATPASDSAFGVSQLVGNGWEWTNTVFGPLPGFRSYATYPGYSANFFDGEHYVMKGGSSRTAAELLRPSFRNWYRRDYPYTYATFRCVENLA